MYPQHAEYKGEKMEQIFVVLKEQFLSLQNVWHLNLHPVLELIA